jgi:hypothetical protein
MSGWLAPELAMATAVGVSAGLAMEALELFVTQPLLIKITGRKPDFSDFPALHGNVKLLLIGLAFRTCPPLSGCYRRPG